ncbi:MAG: PD-(D/E)XK nuclease family protein [Clostridia bacterium]
MKLDFITGITSTIALDELVTRACMHAKMDKAMHYIIVPETRSLEVEEKVLKIVKSTMNIEIVTFARLFEKLKVRNMPFLSKESGVMLLRKIALENTDKLVCYKKSASQAGFAEEMYATIIQLKSSNVTPAELDSSVSLVSSSLRFKMQDIQLIYAEYENFLKTNYIDASDKVMALAEMIGDSELLKNSFVYIVGSNNATTHIYNCVKALIKTAKSVLVSASFLSNNTNSYLTDNEFYESVKRIGDELHLRYTADYIMFDGSDYRRLIAENMFSYERKTFEIGTKIELKEAKTLLSEMQWVAQSIKKEVIENSYRYKDFGIITLKENDALVLQKVFDDYGLPVFVSKQSKLSEEPLFLLISSIISLAQKNFDASDYLLLIKNALCNFSASSCADSENYILQFNINHDAFLSEFNLGKATEVFSEVESLANAEKVRQIVMQDYKEVITNLKQAKTAKAQGEVLLKFIQNGNFKEKTEKLADVISTYGSKEKASFTLQSYEKMIEIIDSLSSIINSCNLSLSGLLEVLSSGANACTISLLPQRLDSVMVASINSNFYNIKHLFVLGANEGMYPLSTQDCGIINDNELNIISSNISKKIEPTIRTVNKREKYKCYESLLLASEKLSICYDAGEVPSSVILQMSRLFCSAGTALNIEPLDSEIGDSFIARSRNIAYLCGSKINAKSLLITALRQYRDGEKITYFDMLNAIYEVLSSYEDVDLSRINNINCDIEIQNIQNAKELFYKENKTSISKLESYFCCPFRHFADYGLKLKPRKEATLKAMDIGDLLHKFVELFMKDIQDGIITEKNIENLAKRKLNYIVMNEKYNAGSNKMLISALEKEVVRLASAMFNEQNLSLFKCTGREVKFKNEAELPPVILESGIMVEGKIDRIDTNGNLFRLIDYKTGNIELGISKLYYGIKLQLFIYLASMNKNSNMKPCGVFYFPIKNSFVKQNDAEKISPYKMQGYYLSDSSVMTMMDSSVNYENPTSKLVPFGIYYAKPNRDAGEIIIKKDKNGFDETEFTKLVDYACKIASKATKEIQDGNIKPLPIEIKNKVVCEHCDYKSICRRNGIQNIKKRKIDDMIEKNDIIAVEGL